MFDIATTRFPKALNNSTDQGIMSDLPVLDRISKVHEYPNDFDAYSAGDWTVTGAGTAALTAGNGGLLLLTTTASTFESIQDNPVAYQMTKGFRNWFQCYAQVDNVLGFIIAGLLNATGTPFTGASQTDGIYFLSGAAGALTANVAVGGVIASVPLGVNLVAAAQAKLSWYYDGGVYAAAPNGRVIFEAKGPGVTATSRVEIAVPSAGTIAAFPGAVNTGLIVGVNASTAAVRTLTLDLLYGAQDRDNVNATPAF